MSWVSVLLALLQIADRLLDIARAKQLIDAGKDAEIAKASASILAKTAAAKAVLKDVMALREDEVDKALRELEP